MEGAFNTIRDFVNNLQGSDDPAADKKIAHGYKVAEAQNRIAVPHNKLKLTAAPEVLDAATRVVSAVMAVARMTTEAFAVVAAQKTASDELNNFTNVIRKAIGKASTRRTMPRTRSTHSSMYFSAKLMTSSSRRVMTCERRI